MTRQSRCDFLADVADGKNIIFYGANTLLIRFISMFCKDNMQSIKYAVDDEKDKHGECICGINLYSSDKLKMEDAQSVVVVITAAYHIKEILEKVLNINPNFKVYMARILVNDMLESAAVDLYDHQNEWRKVCDMLYDDESKRIYSEVINRRMLYGEEDFSDLLIPGDMQYMIPNIFENCIPDREVFVDCGAFTGDTVKHFVDVFDCAVDKIYAFECSKNQLSELNLYVEQAKKRKYCPEIVVMPYAVSDKEEIVELYDTQNPGACFIVENRSDAKAALYNSSVEKVKTVALDQVIPESERVTLIKMDIEGSEYRALEGASRIIKQYKPRLAISIYHSGEDYYKIPFLLKEMVPEYKFMVRHHKKNRYDTDLYCFI